MYKYLILGITLCILGGAGYYFNSSGGSDLIVRAITQSDDTYDTSALEVFSGTYECTEDSGCSTSMKLILNTDTSLKLVEVTEGDEVVIGTGLWGIGKSKSLVFIINPITTGSTSVSISLIAKKVEGLALSEFSSKKTLYSGMINPSFKRISNEY